MKCRTCDVTLPSDDGLSVCPKCFEKVREMHREIRAASDGKPTGVRLGDFVARITKAVGIKECGSCGKRRAALNSVDLKSPLAEIITGISEAILSPEQETQNGTREEIIGSKKAGETGSNREGPEGQSGKVGP